MAQTQRVSKSGEGSLKQNTKVDCVFRVVKHAFEVLLMERGWLVRELRELIDGEGQVMLSECKVLYYSDNFVKLHGIIGWSAIMKLERS